MQLRKAAITNNASCVLQVTLLVSLAASPPLPPCRGSSPHHSHRLVGSHDQPEPVGPRPRVDTRSKKQGGSTDTQDATLRSPTAIGKYKPQDATTNPSLILAASKKAEYAALIDKAVAYAKEHGGSVDEQVDAALDRLLVEFGKEILKIIPGKVTTEVDARFSFDTKASVNKELHIIEVFCLWSEG